jgi:hypothetical protein
MPADAVPGSTIPEDTEAEILLQDGSWVWAQVIGQRKDRRGRWCIGLRWYASPSVGGREGWYLFDPGRIRRPHGPLLRLMQPGWRVRCGPQPGRCVRRRQAEAHGPKLACPITNSAESQLAWPAPRRCCLLPRI